MRQKITTLLNSYSEIFFLQGTLPGLLLMGISFLNPTIGFSGLLAVISAYCFARFIGFNHRFLSSGFYTYNPLLIGFSIGASFKLNIITLLLIVISSILSFMVTSSLAHVFSKYPGIQVLSIPFILVSSIVYLASNSFRNLYITTLYSASGTQTYEAIPVWIQGFFEALGGIVFMPNILAGFLVAMLLLAASRILFFLAFTGFLVGGTLHSIFIGSYTKSFLETNNFNYCLIAMAIGGIYLIPCLESYSLAFIGVAVSSVLISAVNIFWAQYGIPIFTLPFTIVTLTMVYVLGLANHKLRPTVHKATPEETLDHYLTNKDRFPQFYTLTPPFQGTWTVWQGFKGSWTHQGPWEYAYDFVKTQEGKTYEQDGSKLDHYFCFKQEVYSPVFGYVVSVMQEFPDGPINSVNTQHNWGNTVTIYDYRGFYVTLAHLLQYSITVKEGDWVVAGGFLGLCGNSGYSPQPHLHVQINALPSPQGVTLPFEWVRYSEQKTYFSHGTPPEKTEITALPFHPFYDQLTTYSLDSIFSFDVFLHEKKQGNFSFTVRMAPDATFYFETKTAKLYFGKIDSTFYVYHLEGKDPFLTMLYLVLPKLPLYGEPQLQWTDNLPNSLLLKGWQRIISTGLHAIWPTSCRSIGHYKYLSYTEITGEISTRFFKKKVRTCIKFEPGIQIKEFQFGNYSFKRNLPE